MPSRAADVVGFALGSHPRRRTLGDAPAAPPAPDATSAAPDLEPGAHREPKGTVKNNTASSLEQDFGGRFRTMSLADVKAEIQADGPGARGVVARSRGPGKLGHM
jgi:hypothetical protein